MVLTKSTLHEVFLGDESRVSGNGGRDEAVERGDRVLGGIDGEEAGEHATSQATAATKWHNSRRLLLLTAQRHSIKGGP
jgi:hypothetical protein